MALRLATSPLAISRSSPRIVAALRASSSTHSRVYFHASRHAAAAAGKSAGDVTEVYKAVAYKKPHTNQLHGSYHWDFERLLSISMVPLFAASAMNGAHPITDSLLGVVVPIHCHVGFDAMITDYLHPGKVGDVGNKALTWTLRGVTLVALYGCYQFNATDIGLTELVKKAWTA
ncbi:membrane anchor subunit of succinate dehydrogenase, Sdh4 [Linnemannia exigua]|uniref:Succinate dehydrogenase [ubiquinone] cytochrome b small subunit n=1 Tax=Linnemannia exigua TaxID=604196 RepID=A0AAD4D9H4_9FUNG|nr:membrane anchor subunit of succinate dehydrogenase, Sdh4 [Linnemannia exigua]